MSFPDRPDARAPNRLPWPAVVLPMLLAVPLAFVWRQPAFLAFALMSPMLAVGQFLYDRRTGRREATERRRRFERSLRDAESSQRGGRDRQRADPQQPAGRGVVVRGGHTWNMAPDDTTQDQGDVLSDRDSETRGDEAAERVEEGDAQAGRGRPADDE